MTVHHRLADLAELVGGRVLGDPEHTVVDVRPLEDAGPQHLSVLHNPKYLQQARQSAAGVIVTGDPGPLEGRNLLICDEPYLALARILELLHPAHHPPAGVHPSAVVDPSATLGEGVSVGPCAVVEQGAVIGPRTVVGPACVVARGARVGADCLLHPRVVVEHGCVIGDRCILQAGVVVGGDGFGFATAAGVHHKVPQVGRAVIEDDVELGANTTIDRGSLGDTIVGRGSKVDNLVMVAHNVRLGQGCILTAQVGIAGSTHLGRYVVMGGQSGVAGHLELGDGAQIAAKAAVFKDLAGGQLYSGIPARPYREWTRSQAAVARLQQLKDRVRELERRLEATPGDDGGDGT